MLDDLTKEIKAQLYERVKSPLFGAFALSWVAWNYRAILAVLSKMTFPETTAYLDALYPSPLHWVGFVILGPLSTAVLFLFVYPHPARAMYRYWANQHKELKKVQQEIEDETPLTQDEAKALRKASLEQVAALEAQILEQRQLNNELNERLRAAAEEANRLTKERDQFSEAAKKVQEELAQHLAEVLHTDVGTKGVTGVMDAATKEVMKAAKKGAMEAATTGVWANAVNPLVSNFNNQPVGHPLPKTIEGMFGESKGSNEVFDLLCKMDEATTKDIAGALNRREEETNQELVGLLRQGVVTRNGDLWRLSARSRILRKQRIQQ